MVLRKPASRHPAPDRDDHAPHTGDGRAFTHLALLHSAVRWAAAIACSLSLHLAGVALLSHMMTGGGTGGGRARNAPLVVNLEQQAPKAGPAATNGGPRNPAPAVPASSFASVFAGGISPLPATYFPTSELDVMPEIQRNIDLNAEEMSQRLERGGSVQLTLWIDETGRVVKAEAVKLSGLPPIVGEAAIEAFLQATFRPGMRNGVAVKSRAKLMVVVSASADS